VRFQPDRGGKRPERNTGEQMLFNLPLDQIDATVLERLKADSVREDRQLEYKEMLPGGSDEEKREFLSDVTGLTILNSWN
jgi:hypothetical protein